MWKRAWLVLAVVAVSPFGCGSATGLTVDAAADDDGSADDLTVGVTVASCMDGLQDGNETGVDCGGACAPCGVGGGCRLGADCSSGLCANNICVAVSAPDLPALSPDLTLAADLAFGADFAPDAAVTAMPDLGGAPDLAVPIDLSSRGTPDLTMLPDLAPALAYQGESGWCNGSATVNLAATGVNACFLTGVSGAFQGGGESVHVSDAISGWTLGGTSLQPLTCAAAGCLIHTPAYTAEASWCQGSNPVALGSASDRVCFLTAMGGHYVGGGEYIQTYVSNNTWYLGGGSNQQSVCASARCVLTASYGGDVSWCQGAADVLVAPEAGHACFLTSISGGFSGGGEAVRLYRKNGNWYLGGMSGQSGMCAHTRCVLY